jgi:hypothetical protein
VIAKTSAAFAFVQYVRHTVNNTLKAATVPNLAVLECRLVKTMIDAIGSREAKIDVIHFVTFIIVES